MNDLDFDSLELIRIPVKLGGKSYTLQEADEAANITFENAKLKAARFSTDGKFVGHGELASGQPLLVSMCLLDADNRPVPIEVIQKWPGRIVDKLFEKIKEISGMNADDTVESLEKEIGRLTERLSKLKADDAAKNGQGAGPSIST